MSPSAIPTEADQVRNIFQRLADTVVAASSLPAIVDDLKGKLEALTKQADELHRTNASLSEALAQSREARNKAEIERSEALSRAYDAERERDTANAKAQRVEDELAHANQQRELISKDRDDKGMALLEAEDKIKALEGKLKDIREYARSAFGLLEPELPKALPEPAPVAFEHDPPPAFLSQAQPEAKRKVYEDPNDPIWNDRSGYSQWHRDSEKSRWYIELDN
jgi:hypothetical protein